MINFDQELGVAAIHRALTGPSCTILSNAGEEASVIDTLLKQYGAPNKFACGEYVDMNYMIKEVSANLCIVRDLLCSEYNKIVETNLHVVFMGQKTTLFYFKLPGCLPARRQESIPGGGELHSFYVLGLSITGKEHGTKSGTTAVGRDNKSKVSRMLLDKQRTPRKRETEGK